MFECPRCENVFPDNTQSCPVCGTVNRKLFKKKTAVARTLICLSDALVIIMSIINFAILVLCSHYCLVFDYGIFAIHTAYCMEYPALIPIEIIFLIALFVAPVLSVIARKKMMKRQKSGIYMMMSIYAGLLIWTIALPVCTFLATLIVTPILNITIIQIYIFEALAVTLSILLLTRKEFVY